MVYVNPFDPATPSDLDPAGQGDDRIRELKAAIIERLETLVADFDGDPLVLLADVIDSLQIKDGAVVTSKIPDNAITTPKIPDGAITLPKIPDNILTIVKMLNGALSPHLAGINTATFTVPGGGMLIGANSTHDETIGVGGASGGKQVIVSVYGSMDPGLVWCGMGGGVGFVTIRIRNLTASPITIPAGVLFICSTLQEIG